MSGNKGIKQIMMMKYGPICMLEEMGIRKIPVSVRRKIKGYKKTDEQITYHHLKPVREGGLATEENGALIKAYNHRWLESLSEQHREEINNQIREWKLNFMAMQTIGERLAVKGISELSFNSLQDECVILPAYDTTNLKREIRDSHKKKSKKIPGQRAKEKRETQQQIKESLESEISDDFER